MTLLNDRYRLEAELGRGGMGAIYRAYDLLLDRPVAVKVLSHPGLGTQGRARLLHEAQAAARLNHPNVVSIYDAGFADFPAESSDQPEAAGPDGERQEASASAPGKDGAQALSQPVPYIVMELVEGHSLWTQKPSSQEEIVAIALQVCAALEHAHSHGIIHRDLKPENVLITPGGVAKLSDFGLAQPLSGQLSLTGEIAEKGVLAGTLLYMAPEQALGQEVDPRADLYSLGVLLYELVTGRTPFSGKDPLDVISQHLYAPVIPPRSFRPELSPAFEGILLKLLSKDPAGRYASAGEVAQALRELAHLAPAETGEALSLLTQLGRGRMVGRRSELGRLRELWVLVQQGSARLALISGEPGVGKTRLANEILLYAQLNGAHVLKGGCYEYEAASPYLPFSEALRDWIHVQHDYLLRQQIDAAGKPGSIAAELSRLAPEIEARLGPLLPNPPLPPNEERLRLFDHLARLLHHLAEEKGLLFFIDDLHWADHGTIALLHYLLRRLRDERLLVLAAYREVELDRNHPLAEALVDWNRERLSMRFPLGRLSQAETGQILANLLGHVNISSEFITVIHHETEGNPFFIEEAVKSLIEGGQIYRVDDHWERKEIADLAIPQSIKEAIGRRLNRLSPACLEALHTAAGLGKTFTFNELAAVSNAGEDQLLNALDEASAAQLLQPGYPGEDARGNGKNGATHAPALSDHPAESFAFTHDKIREVLYEELNPIRRRRLHQRIGEGLERLSASSQAYIQDLAFHFVESGDLPRGLRYSIQAAESGERLFAHEEALRYYERAVECAEALNETEQLAEIHTAIGQVYFWCGPFSRAVEAYQRALALSKAIERRAALKMRIGSIYANVGDERGLPYLQEALDELNPQTQPNDLGWVYTMLGRYHHYRREFDKAVQFLTRACEIATPLDNPDTLGAIYAFFSGTCQQSGKWEESNAWAQRCIELGERLNYPHASALGYEFLAENAYVLGDWRASLSYAARDREIGERIGSQSRIAWAESAFAHAHHVHGDLPAALQAIQRSLEITDRIGDRRLAVMLRARRSQLYADLGDFEAAQADADWVMARAAESGQQQIYFWALGAPAHLAFVQGQGEALLALSPLYLEKVGNRPLHQDAMGNLLLGNLEQAANILNGLSKQSPESELPLDRAWRLMMLGMLHRLRGAFGQAAAPLDEAVSILEAHEAWLYLARALEQRSRLRKGQGDEDGARADSEHAGRLFQECGVIQKPVSQ